MPIIEPKIDNRSYQEFLNEALARIPVHNPEWTNFNDSDPGITIIQLSAFMMENLLYRANLVPERNRKKFLKLLGISVQPAEPARGIVTFDNTRGPIQSVYFSSDMELFAGQIPFRTEDGVDVLPLEARVYFKSRIPEVRRAKIETFYEQLYGSFKGTGIKLELYETKPLEFPASGAAFPVVDLTNKKNTSSADTSMYAIDGSLWIALLARSSEAKVVKDTIDAIANKELTLGILPDLTDSASALLPQTALSDSKSILIYEMPLRDEKRNWTLPEQMDQRIAKYKKLEARSTGDILSEPGLVKLKLPARDDLGLWDNLEPLEQGVGDFPPLLERNDLQKRIITWIRIKVNSDKQQFRARLNWVGINAAHVVQRAHIYSELLGSGTGEPDQMATLVNKPIIPGSVNLTVNGEPWYEIDDLMAADSEVPVRDLKLPSGSNQSQALKVKSNVNVYTVDRESGEIKFGDGIHGARPPFGATIRASYDYGGGNAGRVGIGTINKSPSMPAGTSVTNPIPTWGGSDTEPVDTAEKRIPSYLKHRDRLVSKTDFEEITFRTPGVEVGRVEVLPLVHPCLPDAYSQGIVTILIIPRYDPIFPDAPSPDRLFLDTVCRYLNPRRLVTTELYICGPEYVNIWVSVGIEVIPGTDLTPVIDNVKKEIRSFLSSLTGGFENEGWQLEKNIEAMEIMIIAARVSGVSKVNSILLSTDKSSSTQKIQITGLQLPRLVGLGVQQGDPQDIAELRGETTTGSTPFEGEIKIIPVPTVSEFQC